MVGAIAVEKPHKCLCRCVGAALIRQHMDGLGSSGTLVAYHCPAVATDVVNLSGAGDCLVAGFVAGLLCGHSEQQALALGVVAASVAVRSTSNVPSPVDGLQLDKLQAQVPTLMRQVQCYHLQCIRPKM
jgi:bifunctional ADP-heptose synthase (sugar kinase/adenylyltransferase)